MAAQVIGVAISTHARPGVLAQSLTEWAKHLPDLLVVTHDVTGEGVAATKNRGISALMDAGVEHLFLADDDIWPLKPRWWKPYLDHRQPHLSMCWGVKRLRETTSSSMVYTWPCGVLLYARRHVIERVGGMRTEFGRWGHEHVEWSLRIHTAGLTAHPYQDLRSSASLFYALDAHRSSRGNRSTVTRAERLAGERQRDAAWERFAGSEDFVPYR